MATGIANRAPQPERDEIQGLIGRINQAWLNERTQELNEYFHEEVVTRGPSFQFLGSGREPCVKSYEDFLRQAKVREFKESAHEVNLFGDTAVAKFAWEITYEMNGQSYHEFGHDLFVFVRRDGRWLAAWRAVLPSPQP